MSEYSRLDLIKVYKTILELKEFNEDDKVEKCFELIEKLSESDEISLPDMPLCVNTYDEFDLKNNGILYEEFKEENMRNNKRYVFKTMLNILCKNLFCKFPTTDELPFIKNNSSKLSDVRIRVKIVETIPIKIKNLLINYGEFIDEQSKNDIYLVLVNRSGFLRFKWIDNFDNDELEEFEKYDKYLKIKIFPLCIKSNFYISYSLVIDYEKKINKLLKEKKEEIKRKKYEFNKILKKNK